MQRHSVYKRFFFVSWTGVAAARRNIYSLEFGRMAEVQRTGIYCFGALHLQPDDRHGVLRALPLPAKNNLNDLENSGYSCLLLLPAQLPLPTATFFAFSIFLWNLCRANYF